MIYCQGLLTEKDQENLDLKNELNLLKQQMPTTAGEDDDIVMKAVEERVKQWKVWAFYIYLFFNTKKFLFLRIFLNQKMMKQMILNEK